MTHCCEEWFLDYQPVYRCWHVWDHAFGSVMGMITVG